MTSIPTVSDEHLVQQIVQGDLLAFESLYNRHIRSVYRRVRFAVPEVDVEDVTQEIFLAVIGSLSTFRGEAQFTTWLYTLTNRKVAEYYRKRYRKKETLQVDLIEAEECCDPNTLSDLDEMIDVQNAFNRLPQQYREVILLRFANGMQFPEIAINMKKNMEATKTLFRRAIYKLREIWEEDDEENSKQ